MRCRLARKGRVVRFFVVDGDVFLLVDPRRGRVQISQSEEPGRRIHFPLGTVVPRTPGRRHGTAEHSPSWR